MPAYFEVKMRIRYAKCVQVGRSDICINIRPKCSHKERRCGFSNRSSVDAVLSGRRCVFLGESKSTLFGLPKLDAFRNH